MFSDRKVLFRMSFRLPVWTPRRVRGGCVNVLFIFHSAVGSRIDDDEDYEDVGEDDGNDVDDDDRNDRTFTFDEDSSSSSSSDGVKKVSFPLLTW